MPWVHGALALGLVMNLACRGREEAPEPVELVSHFDLVEELQWARGRPLSNSPYGIESVIPRATDDGSLLVLPVDTRVDYYLEIPAGAELRFERLSARGEPAPRLLIRLLGPEAGEKPVTLANLEAQLPEQQEDLRVALPPTGVGLRRLTLMARPGKVAAAPAGAATESRDATDSLESPASPEPRLVLRRPAIYAPEPPSQAPVTARQNPKDSSAKPPHILIYLVDTLRADALTPYGGSFETSPALDAFAQGATVFEDAVAQSSWTRAAVASLFTGLPPRLHGVQDRVDTLPPAALTLAELLSAAGYETAAFVSNGNVGVEFGFDQGFDVFYRTSGGHNRSDEIEAQVERFLLQRADPGRPLFLYVHTIDPHAPYNPPADQRRRWAEGVATSLGSLEYLKERRRGFHAEHDVVEEVSALYRGEVAANDLSFGLFLEALEGRGMADEAVVVFLSDHGEELWEHDGWGHGHNLYREVLQVPLVVRLPGQQQGRRRMETVQHTDLFTTLLDLAGVETPAWARGRSLKASLEGGEAPPPAGIHSDLQLDGREATSLIAGEWKFIVPRSLRFQREQTRRPQLFHRGRDPLEQSDLAAEDPLRVGMMLREVRRYEANAAVAFEPGRAEMSEELVQELKALGYLQ